MAAPIASPGTKRKKFKVDPRLELIDGDPYNPHSRNVSLNRINQAGESTFVFNFSRRALPPIIAVGLKICATDPELLAAIKGNKEMVSRIKNGFKELVKKLQ